MTAASFVFAKGLVVLDPAAVEIIYALGAQDQIAAIATTSMSKIRPEAETAYCPFFSPRSSSVVFPLFKSIRTAVPSTIR